MRHRHVRGKLGRDTAARKALLRNLATSLVLYERVRTTRAKAKAIQPYIERVITTGRQGRLVDRRMIIPKLMTENAVKKVMEVLGPRYKKRAGGYTRIVPIGHRKGDGAPMVTIEFVETTD